MGYTYTQWHQKQIESGKGGVLNIRNFDKPKKWRMVMLEFAKTVGRGGGGKPLLASPLPGSDAYVNIHVFSFFIHINWLLLKLTCIWLVETCTAKACWFKPLQWTSTWLNLKKKSGPKQLPFLIQVPFHWLVCWYTHYTVIE